MGNDDAAARCLKRHSLDIATISGLFLFIGIVFGVLVAVVPANAAKPGEEEARFAIGLFALAWLVAGVVHRIVTKGKRDRIVALLGPARAELARATRVEIRRRHVRRYAVDLVDRSGRTFRLWAPDERAATDLAAKLM